MSNRELGRVEALARVRSKQLRLVDAARLMRVCYRQAKRLWRRYREEGAAGLKHRSAGRPSHHAHEQKFRRNVLRLVRAKYGGPVGERFGPTLAGEHLASWFAGGRRNAVTLDAGRGVMEPGAQTAAAPTPARAQGALWRNGAAGRELSPVAGGTRPGRLLDR